MILNKAPLNFSENGVLVIKEKNNGERIHLPLEAVEVRIEVKLRT